MTFWRETTRNREKRRADIGRTHGSVNGENTDAPILDVGTRRQATHRH